MASTVEDWERTAVHVGELFRWQDFLQEEALGELTDGYSPNLDEYLLQELLQLRNRNHYSISDMRVTLDRIEAAHG